MSLLVIPDRFHALISSNRRYSEIVSAFAEDLELFLSSQPPAFFPEYTEHGPQHISEVLSTAEALMRAEAWSSFSSSDAVVLVLGTILHDAALHLTEDGFNALLTGSSKHEPIPGLGVPAWDLTWRRFMDEAKRFTGRQLTAMFGDSEPVRVPPSDPDKMTLRDRKLIGEFLRRHHPRLAHEIAVYGVPGPMTRQLQLTNANRDIRDLAGLIARSHGLPLRTTFAYLKANYDLRDYNGVHAVFLMTLLRIADYLQIQGSRAPQEHLMVSLVRSPYSRREWAVHACVKNITRANDDPESIRIDARPQDLRTFLRVSDWLKGVQEELDASWSVIGEVYGRYAGLNSLGLTIRRVTSNLDDVESFAETVNYVPHAAAFESVDPDLLKLLIAPLYSDHKPIAIRELLQNSLDAVREVAFLRQQPIDPKRQPDVLICIEDGADGAHWLTVLDRGIGMTVHIIQNYFLKAGASFRNSEAWRTRFEGDNRISRIVRSGRFGVGALAAFLLGDRMEVTTRHVESDRGIFFTASMDDASIELRHADCPIGTRVRIGMDSLTRDFLVQNEDLWDWYVLAWPAVSRKICGPGPNDEIELPQRRNLPAPKDPLPPDWFRVKHSDYYDIQWSYSMRRSNEASEPEGLDGPRSIRPDLWHNGIRIERVSWRTQLRSAKWGPPFVIPDMSIFDAGALPLNLQKSETIGDSCPFENQLSTSIAKVMLSFALQRGPDGFDPAWNDESVFRAMFGEPIISNMYPWFFLEDGFCFVDSTLISDLNLSAAITYSGIFYSLPWFESKFEHAPAVFEYSPPHQFDLLHPIGPIQLLDLLNLTPFPPFSIRGLRVFAQRWLGATRRLDLSRFTKEKIFENGTVYSRGDCPVAQTDFEQISRLIEGTENFDVLVEWYPASEQPPLPPSPVAEVWQQAVPDTVLPFDVKRRGGAIRRARAVLGDILDGKHTLFW